MRILKILFALVLAVLAVAAGVFVAAAVAVAVVLFLVIRWVQRRLRGGNPAPALRKRPTAAGDAIDVTATEVGEEKPKELHG